MGFLLLAISAPASLAASPASNNLQTSETAAVPFALTGKVSTVDGGGIEGASLRLFTYSGNNDSLTKHFLGVTTSSQDGAYSILGAITINKKKPSYVMLQAGKDGYVRLLHVMYEFMAASDVGYEISAIQRDVVLPAAAVIEGRLTNENGEPFPGVFLQGNPTKAVKEAVVADTAVTTSSATGHFRLDGLPEGEITLSASLGRRTLLNTSTTAPVGNLHLQLSTAGSTITGAVVLQNGTPVPGAEVLLQRAIKLDASGFRTDKPTKHLSDGQGRFLFNNLSEGNYKLTPSAKNLQAYPKAETENFGFFSLASAETTSGIRLEMYTGTIVTGTIREAGSGKPLAGVDVFWGNPELNPHVPTAVSGPDGTYRLDGVFPDTSGDGQIYAAADGYVLRTQISKSNFKRLGADEAVAHKPVKVSRGASTLEANLELQPARTITGTIYDEIGTPMAGVDIFVGKMWTAMDKQNLNTVTDALGNFSVDAGPENGNLIFATAKQRPVVTIPVPNVGGAQTSVTITVHPPATITGMVLTPEGQPAGNAHIQVGRDESAHITGMASNLPPARSRPDGTIKIENLPGGKISLHAQMEGYVPSDFERLELKPGEKRSGVTLRLGKGYTIEGRITDGTGKPVVDARITVDAVNTEKMIFANTQSGLDGRYKLTSVPDAPVNIKFWAPRAGLNGELLNVRPSAGGAQDIVLK